MQAGRPVTKSNARSPAAVGKRYCVTAAAPLDRPHLWLQAHWTLGRGCHERQLRYVLLLACLRACLRLVLSSPQPCSPVAPDLVGRQNKLRSCGVVQLFTTSHPMRRATSTLDDDLDTTTTVATSLAVDLQAITAALHLDTPSTQPTILEAEMLLTSLHSTSSVEVPSTRAVVPSTELDDGMHWDLFCFAIVVGQLYLAKRLK